MLNRELVKDIDLLLEKLDVQKMEAKEYRGLSKTLEVLFSIIQRDADIFSPEYISFIEELEIKLNNKIEIADKFKTGLLEDKKYKMYQDTIFGYEKLLNLQRRIKNDKTTIKRRYSLPQYKNK